MLATTILHVKRFYAGLCCRLTTPYIMPVVFVLAPSQLRDHVSPLVDLPSHRAGCFCSCPRADRGLCRSSGLPESAVPGCADVISTENTAADFQHGGQPDRRIRRG